MEKYGSKGFISFIILPKRLNYLSNSMDKARPAKEIIYYSNPLKNHSHGSLSRR
jgi:hypothetical protein